ncbi:hypothetical protein ACH4C2_33725 [Streptomyces sp. NPDC018057]|uniref:hypothetical protein n=1 Tax=unclassified Streptomyces TaxID=2593676 RepID=UPI0037BD64B4
MRASVIRVGRVWAAVLAVLASLFVAGAGQAAADDLPPLPLGSDCNLVGETQAGPGTMDFRPTALQPTRIEAPGGTAKTSTTGTRTESMTTTATISVSAKLSVAEVEASASTGHTAQQSLTYGTEVQQNVSVRPGQYALVSFGVYSWKTTYARTYTIPGCNKDASALSWFADYSYMWVPMYAGWKIEYFPPNGSGSSGGNPPGPVTVPTKPQLVTSVYGLPDGTVLNTNDTHRVYKMAGGAPIWQSTCDGGLCPDARPTTQAVIDAGPAAPSDGATVQDQQGQIFKFAGGAPIHMATCDGSGCGTPVKISTWSVAALDHMRPVPSDGATVQDQQGQIFKFAGGAPIHMATCDGSGCGSPVKVSTWSIATLDHMRSVPADGATVQDQQGQIFKFAGGAPIHMATCDGSGCGSPVKVSTWSIATLDHMNSAPVDGSTVQDQQGQIFKFAGGAPIHMATCDGSGCGTPVKISTWSIAALEHMRPYPTDGTTIRDQQGQIFKFAGGAPVHMATCDPGCGAPVPVSTWSISHLDHMLAAPMDGATVSTENGTVYKFAAGYPFRLSGCSSDCGFPVPITQWSVDHREHMADRPVDGISLVAADTGTLYRTSGGFTDPVGPCPQTGGCQWAPRVDQSSVEFLTDPSANHGPLYGQLTRYVNGSGDHYSATGSVPPGYRAEGPLGQLDLVREPGTHPLYACQNGAEEFSSVRDDCEGSSRIALLGHLYDSPAPDGPPMLAVYRCKDGTAGEHFDSTDPKCEGKVQESLLGYTIGYGALTRYVHQGAPSDHWTTTRAAGAGYRPEIAMGMVSLVGGPGTRALYSCRSGSDEFTSLQADCEGATKLAGIGWAWEAPVAGVPSLPLYRCRIADGEHFVSHDPKCEGMQQETLLGYVVARAAVTRSIRGTDHAEGTAGLSAGYRAEAVHGYLSLVAEPGTEALYQCRAGGDDFTSLDSACEGQTVQGTLGYLWSEPPAGRPSTPVYRCNTGGGDHFDSVREDCEGQHAEGLQGYLLTTP